MKKHGFTLAEVLITLTIIGVIAVMTIPTLMYNYQRIKTETKLKSFYSTVSQAYKQWLTKEHIDTKDINFDSLNSGARMLAWWNNNIGREIKSISVRAIGGPYIKVLLPDGSAFYTFAHRPPNSTHRILTFYYCVHADKCGDTQEAVKADGRNTFVFTLEKDGTFMTSYDIYHAMTRAQILNAQNGCRRGHDQNHGCARLIELDNWKIKSDYPCF